MKKIYLLLFAFCLTTVGFGQTLATIDRANTVPTNTSTAANVTAIGLSRTGLTLDTGTDFSTKGWETGTTLNTAQFLQWSVKGNTGYSMIISGVDIRYRRLNNQAPKTISIYYSYNNFATSTLLTTATYANNDTAQKTITENLTGVAVGAGSTITFRLYGYEAANANGQLNIEGNTAWAIPATAVTNPGIRVRGTLSTSALNYTGGAWTPFAPNTSTGNNTAFIVDGTYTPTANISLNSLTVRPEGNLSISAGITLTCPANLFESTSTRYSSLILNGTISGTVNYIRHVNTGSVAGVGGNDLISAPLSGQPFNLFKQANGNIKTNVAGTLNLFGPFEKPSNVFLTYANGATNILEAGQGYRAASTGGGFNFTGTVNTGTVTRSIENSGTSFAPWNLIGNPYPSYMYVQELTGAGAHPGFINANIAQFGANYVAIYGYDNNSSDGDVYTIWNLANTTPSTVITPGQGFFVASKAGGGSVNFTAGMRAIGSTDDFIIGRQANEDHNASLKLRMTNGTNNFVTDIYFNDASTLGLDPGYDAGLFGGSTPTFSIFSQLVEMNTGVNMAIQSLPYSSLVNEVTVPIGMRVTQGQQITISILDSNIPAGVEVYLEDTVANTSTLLNSSDYVFTTPSNMNGVGRFYLRFTNSTLSTTETAFNGLHIFSTSTPRVLFIKGQLSSATNVSLYDIQGRMVMSTVLDSASNSNQVDVSNLSSGVYVVKLTNSAQQKTQKVILK